MRMIKPGRRTIRWLPVLLAMLTLAGCGGWAPFQDLPGGGVDAESGQVRIDDMWVDGPHGLTAGGSAPLRLAITNASPTADTLVGVSTPIAERAVLEQNGQPVAGIALPASGFDDLEWRTGVELEGLRTSLAAGTYIPVTLRFAHAAPVTVRAAIGPLAVPEPQDPSTSA
ncbi:copper(I)-binding protein [Kribbella sp. VKM Ac-2527]|uniref:Copper(I)-binding protein n=1 Tax=Kribbella caucasensis TaxID=2512215 RepID=A0A4R6KQ50_9ACTN|nr:copper chaperone PCu(A)C [Kribbella sp. VKM Ac-2527]TDO51749.1 copper(I)-binding protein [Kribbella sp. VKM Ac-2527]